MGPLGRVRAAATRIAGAAMVDDPGPAFVAPRTIGDRDLLLKAGPLLSTLSRFDTELSTASAAVGLAPAR